MSTLPRPRVEHSQRLMGHMHTAQQGSKETPQAWGRESCTHGTRCAQWAHATSPTWTAATTRPSPSHKPLASFNPPLLSVCPVPGPVWSAGGSTGGSKPDRASVLSQCMVGAVITANYINTYKNCQPAQHRYEPKGCIPLQDFTCLTPEEENSAKLSGLSRH